MLWKSKKKDLPKQYTVWAKDLKDGGEDIQRSGDDGFPLFADAVNWAFDHIPATYHITIKCGEITVFEVCLFGLKGELLNENGCTY